ncbi:uncharacterized protein LOC134780069 [Penaeus indicus]|uniref:uncharacterized protein LOC134780069 n=1 Tax=Penaeus indicus TaxID=29960 RepID=UPI00300D0CA2
MASSVQEMLIASVPDHLKEEVSGLISSSRTEEEERLRKRRSEGRKFAQFTDDEIKRKGESMSLHLAIARLVMEVWSPKMKRHVEHLILQKAVQEKYLEERHLKWVNVLDGHESDSLTEEESWLIDNQDDTMVDLLWNIFNMKQHFQQTYGHRLWIQRSFDRLSSFMPELHPEIIDRHDLSKFAFSQAVGYTIKWVHNGWHSIWAVSCNLHLNNEPHHPDMWSNNLTPQEKHRRLELWTKDACDFHKGTPYGISLTAINLRSEELALPFLLESFIDMVAIEWERKKGKNPNITNADLAYVHERYLERYSIQQKQIIQKLIKTIQSSEEEDQSSIGFITEGLFQ